MTITGYKYGYAICKFSNVRKIVWKMIPNGMNWCKAVTLATGTWVHLWHNLQYRNDGNNQICVPRVLHANRNQYAWWHKSSPLLRKILLSTMYLNLFFSVGEKQTPPPTRLHLGICTIHQLADQSVAWLIDCYRRVGVNNHLRTTPSIFTSLKNYQCQNQCIIPFTHRLGGRMKILHLSWI